MKIASLILLVCAALLFFRSIDALLAGGHQRANVMSAVLPVTEPLITKIEDQKEKDRAREEIVTAAHSVVREIDDHLITFALYGFVIATAQSVIGIYLFTRPNPKDENGAQPVATDNEPQLPDFDYFFSMRLLSAFCAGRA